MFVKKRNENDMNIVISRAQYLQLVDAVYLAQMYMHDKGDFQWSDELGQLADTMFIEYRSIYGGEH